MYILMTVCFRRAILSRLSLTNKTWGCGNFLVKYNVATFREEMDANESRTESLKIRFIELDCFRAATFSLSHLYCRFLLRKTYFSQHPNDWVISPKLAVTTFYRPCLCQPAELIDEHDTKITNNILTYSYVFFECVFTKGIIYLIIKRMNG